jgi:hypothetical protein
VKEKRTVSSEAAAVKRAGRAHEEEEAPFERGNLRPQTTGLPMTIWVSERGRARHAPRIKVSLQHGPKIDVANTLSATIEDEPRLIGGELVKSDYEAVKQHIRINREVLLAYWNGDIDTAELIRRLQRIGPAHHPRSD